MNASYIRSVVYVLVFIAVLFFYKYGRGVWTPVVQKVSGKNTVQDVIDEYGARSRAGMAPYFSGAGLDYPPKSVTFLALKKERILELWAGDGNGYKFIRRYNIQRLSGTSGPKLREGDLQVPEGIYRIIGLNPNSSYHLSMKLNYPNAFDIYHAKREGRERPGSDIFIHGKDVSIGCLAMGDRAIEELFVLVHDVGKDNIQVLIAPYDPRKSALDATAIKDPDWLPGLYERISKEFNRYRASG